MPTTCRVARPIQTGDRLRTPCRRPLSRRVSVTPERERTLQHPQPPALPDLDNLMKRVAAGDENAFATLYDAIAPRAYGLVRRIMRDPALAEEVTQDALIEVWRNASRFDTERGSAVGWVLSIAHHRAVDRVRAEQAAADRERRAGTASVPFDEVIAEVTARLEQDAVRRCLRALTGIQREAILLAYYGGLTYRDVAERRGTALPTIKTPMRDGLIRLRDCLWGSKNGGIGGWPASVPAAVAAGLAGSRPCGDTAAVSDVRLPDRVDGAAGPVVGG